MKQGGAHAASSGKVLENIVESALSAKGLAALTYKDWQKLEEGSKGEYLVRNVPYDSLYQHASKTEFLAISENYNILTRIECKWQQASGSVDEKFPYLFLNCAQKMTEPHVIILLDGGGAKSGAIAWLKEACAKFNNDNLSNNRRIDLMNTTEFIQWVNKAFK